MSYPKPWQYFPTMARGHGSTRPRPVKLKHKILPAKKCVYPDCKGELDERHYVNPMVQAHVSRINRLAD